MEPETETLYICVSMGDEMLTEIDFTIERDDTNNIVGAIMNDRRINKEQAVGFLNLLLDTDTMSQQIAHLNRIS